MKLWRFNESVGLTDFNIEVIEEVQYLVTTEDILIKKCFGQNKIIKELFKECGRSI